MNHLHHVAVAITVDSTHFARSQFVSTGNALESDKIPFASSSLECGSLCLANPQCSGYNYDSQCKLYYGLTEEDITSSGGDNLPTIMILTPRIAISAGKKTSYVNDFENFIIDQNFFFRYNITSYDD